MNISPSYCTHSSGAEDKGVSVVLDRVLVVAGDVACLAQFKCLVASCERLGGLCREVGKMIKGLK